MHTAFHPRHRINGRYYNLNARDNFDDYAQYFDKGTYSESYSDDSEKGDFIDPDEYDKICRELNRENIRNSRLQTTNGRLNRDNQKLQATNRHILRENEALQLTIDAQSEEVDELKSTLRVAQDSEESIYKQLHKALAKIQKMDLDAKQAKDDVDNSIGKAERNTQEAERKTQEARERAVTAEEESTKAKAQLEHNESQLNKIYNEMEQSRNTLKQKDKELRIKNMHIWTIYQQRRALEKQLKTAGDSQEMKDELANLRTQATSHRDRLDAAVLKERELCNMVAALNREVIEAKRDTERAREEASEARRSLAKVEGERDYVMGKHREVLVTLQTVKPSTIIVKKETLG
ncbi:hypothetical protein FRB93_010661 [Tulasnella sp. JGI-2019a]|nr:hypothetical protein FRB93_010661 [Tulasnella sp. JGI-2019a]